MSQRASSVMVVRTGKCLKKRAGRKEEKQVQLRGGRWHQLVLENDCVGQGEKRVKNRSLLGDSCRLYSEIPKPTVVCLDEGDWLSFKHFEFEEYPKENLHKY